LMKVKTKRFLLFLMTIMIFGTTVCTASVIYCVANQTEYRDSAYSATKTTRDNSALLTVTSGPDRVYAPISSYVKQFTQEETTLKTNKTTLYTVCTNKKLYYDDPFVSTEAMGKEYRAYFQILRYSRYTSVLVNGSLIP